MPKPSKIITELAIQKRSDPSTPSLTSYPRIENWIAAILEYLDSQVKKPTKEESGQAKIELIGTKPTEPPKKKMGKLSDPKKNEG